MIRVSAIALLLLVGVATAAPVAYTPVAPTPAMVAAIGVPRGETPTCGEPHPVELTFYSVSEEQEDAVSLLFWKAGIPAGSHVRFTTDAQAGRPIPLAPTLEWARGVLCE